MGRVVPTRGGVEEFLSALADAPEYVNPAIALAAEIQRAEALGDQDALDRAVRNGSVERAISEGQKEGRDLLKMLVTLGHVTPASSKRAPTGF